MGMARDGRAGVVEAVDSAASVEAGAIRGELVVCQIMVYCSYA